MSAIKIAAELIKEALAHHIKGKNKDARLDAAVDDVVDAVAHLITVRDDVKKSKLGATVMTPEASMFKRPGTAPRSL